jgi:hypothetical protein
MHECMGSKPNQILVIMRGGSSDSISASRNLLAAGQDIEDLGVDADFSDEEAAGIANK